MAPSSAKCTTLQELHLYTATLLNMMNQEAPMYFTAQQRDLPVRGVGHEPSTC